MRSECRGWNTLLSKGNRVCKGPEEAAQVLGRNRKRTRVAQQSEGKGQREIAGGQ